RTGRPLPPFTGAGPHRVERYGFLAGGKVLAALGTDAILRAWDTATGKVLHETRVAGAETARRWQEDGYWYAHTHRPSWHAEQCPAFGPGNATLAVVGDDARLTLWDVATGRRLARLDARHPPRALVAFALDGRALVSECPDRALRLWDLPSGKPLAKIDAAEKSEPFFAFAGDGPLLAWGCGESIHVWDRGSGKETARLKGHAGRTEHVAFDRDNRTLISAGQDRTVRLWDAWTGQELRQLRDDRGGSGSTSFHVGPDGRLLPLISTCPKNSHYSLREACTGREVCELHTGWGWGFAMSPDGRVLVTSREFVETATGREISLSPQGHRGGIRALAFSPDGRFLATGGTDTSILLWDWQRLAHPKGDPAKQKEPAALWKDLAAAEASTAYRATGALVADPAKAIALLKQHLRPVGTEDRERVRRLLKDLESRRFAERERAVQELTKVTAEWEPLLREAMGARPALEVRRRLEPLLDSAALRHWSPETVRGLRALQVLEQIGDAEARRLLQRVADGLPEARLTQEAKAALHRLDRRAAQP
ncbi:MAG TPA: WD40 repeat domain-containing protein, partial [Gemmataceae bacterium]|nr:WD40 repeat domain-containing protein [Gemmataceae bacterium]